MGGCRTPSGPEGSSGKQCPHVPRDRLAGAGCRKRSGIWKTEGGCTALFVSSSKADMNYLVLARKWRPQKWEDVVAQEHVTVTLRNAIAHSRLAHAYLFAGPR